MSPLKPVLVDSAVLIYSAGGEHPLRPVCQTIVLHPERFGWKLACSVEAIQEFAFHRRRRVSGPEASAEARAISVAADLIDFNQEVLYHSLSLIAEHDVRGRDAVHAATALCRGINTIISTDDSFDSVPRLTRIDPASLSV